MGQARIRGSFEQRKAQSITKREYYQRVDREAHLLQEARSDTILDRGYKPPYETVPHSRAAVYVRD